MKFCPNCGNKLDGNAKFCTVCGNKIAETQYTEPTSAQTNAGPDNEPLYKQYMGDQVNQNPAPNNIPTAPAPAPKKKKPIVFILIAVGIIVVIALTATMCSAMGNVSNGNSFTSSDTEVNLDEPTVAPSTDGEQAALDKAYDYLSALAFSYDGLVDQLEYEGFTYSEAVYAADNCGADWYQQAVLKALDYLDTMAFSYDGLVDQLEYEGFTYDQAIYGVDNCNADWYEQAERSAQEYLEFMDFTRSELIDQLVFEGFTYSEAEYGVDAAGL